MHYAQSNWYSVEIELNLNDEVIDNWHFRLENTPSPCPVELLNTKVHFLLLFTSPPIHF